MDLKGKRALVTGSTSGIGLGIAEELARAGCDIALNGFGDATLITTLQARLSEAYGVRVVYIPADVGREIECTALIDNVFAAFGGIDILVNNAGIQHVAPIEAFPTERWDAILAINLSAAFHLTSAVLPYMRDNGYGRIINISSTHGLVASKFKSAYVAAKHGLIGLTKVIALETAGQGITCNAICPGWTLTPLAEAQVTARMEAEDLGREEVLARTMALQQPSGQFTRTDQLGKLACFLCSEAASNMTGASLPMDGAWTAQ